MISWPPSLETKPERAGFQMTPEPNTISFQSEVGIEIVRRRSTAPRQVIAAQFLFDTSELSIFQIFFRDELRDGVLPFAWEDPIEEVSGQYRILGYTVANVGGDLWRISAQIRRIK